MEICSKLVFKYYTQYIMEPHHLICDRWSPVAFDERELEIEKIESLFKAAMWAPSSRNIQPWRFIYVSKSHEDYQSVFDLLVEGNKTWAFTAPVLAISIDADEDCRDVKGKR